MASVGFLKYSVNEEETVINVSHTKNAGCPTDNWTIVTEIKGADPKIAWVDGISDVNNHIAIRPSPVVGDNSPYNPVDDAWYERSACKESTQRPLN